MVIVVVIVVSSHSRSRRSWSSRNVGLVVRSGGSGSSSSKIYISTLGGDIYPYYKSQREHSNNPSGPLTEELVFTKIGHGINFLIKMS